MLHWIKNHKAILLCAVSAAAVNLLMLAGLLENRQQSFFGDYNRKMTLAGTDCSEPVLFFDVLCIWKFYKKKEKGMFYCRFHSVHADCRRLPYGGSYGQF